MNSQYWGDVQTDPNRFRIVMWSSSISETENDALQEEVVTPLVEMSRDTYRLSRAVFMARYFEKEMEDERRGGGKCRKRYFACKHGLASVTYSKCTPVSSVIVFENRSEWSGISLSMFLFFQFLTFLIILSSLFFFFFFIFFPVSY